MLRKFINDLTIRILLKRMDMLKHENELWVNLKSTVPVGGEWRISTKDKSISLYTGVTGDHAVVCVFHYWSIHDGWQRDFLTDARAWIDDRKSMIGRKTAELRVQENKEKTLIGKIFK